MSQDNVTHEQIRKDTQKYKATENGIWTDSKWRDFSLAFRKPKKRMKRLLDILSAFLGGILTHPQGWEFALLNPTNLHLKGFGWSLVEWGCDVTRRWKVVGTYPALRRFYFLFYFFRFVGVDLFFVCLFCLLCALSVALFFRFSFCFCFFFRFVLLFFFIFRFVVVDFVFVCFVFVYCVLWMLLCFFRFSFCFCIFTFDFGFDFFSSFCFCFIFSLFVLIISFLGVSFAFFQD